jgi:hypothetical protein
MGHSRQLNESEKSFTGAISKGKQILMLKFSKLVLLSPPFEANLSSHLNLSQLQKERRRSLAGARDDRYVVY